MSKHKWYIPMMVGLIMFGNHYTRDSVGALEKQLENNLQMSSNTYMDLNAIYFLPNILTPLLAGLVIDRFGGTAVCYIYSTCLASLGFVIFALGVQFKSVPCLFIGRSISGSMYEIIDALLPITFVAPLFPNDWILVVGILNVFIRMGSVLNFIVSPILYAKYGLSAAFWMAALIGSSSIPFVLIATNIEKKIKDENMRDKKLTSSGVEMVHFVVEDNDVNDVDSNDTNLDNIASTQRLKPFLFLDYIVDLPYFKLGLPFYLYLLSGSLLYGSIVPFWFIGSKYMQDNLQLSVYVADALIGIPDAMIIAVCLPLGLVVGRCGFSLTSQLAYLSLSAMFMAASFLLLVGVSIRAQSNQKSSIFSHISSLGLVNSTHISVEYNNTASAASDNITLPYQDNTVVAIISMLALGLSFATGYSFFWGLVTKMADTSYIAPASGLVSCAVNVLPAIVPPLLRYLTIKNYSNNLISSESVGSSTSNVSILVLASMAVLSGLCAALAGFSQRKVVSNEAVDCNERDHRKTSKGDLVAYKAVESDDDDGG